MDIKGFLRNVRKYWNIPPQGRCVPFKEVVAYGVGGMGVHFATTLSSAIALSASNFLVGASLNIDPVHLQVMNLIATVFGFLVTLVRSYLFDNTKSKDGKFRPWLKWMGVPTVLSSVLFVWLPYEQMGYMEKLVAVELCYLLINCFSPFFVEAFNLLIQVMSPHTEERTDIMSVGQILFSFAPTLTNLVIPALAPLTGGLNNIATYRVIYPAFTLVGLALTYFIYAGTKERIIYAKQQDRSIRFTDAVRSVAKNKYFWITNVATWIGFLESAYLTILQWTFVYAMPEKQAWLGVANTVIGNGALWSMMITPFLIRRFGKRNLLIWCNVVNILLLGILYFSFTNIWAVMVICYINNFINVFSNIYNPGIQADMKDYQQWKTGERIDGMFGAVGIIGSIIGLGTGFVLPALYRAYGLTTDYNVLYDATIRTNIFRMLIVASVIGAVLNVVPFFFYDLTEEKHKGIVAVLRIRALFDDFAAGVLDDAELRSGGECLEHYIALEHASKEKLPRQKLKDARALPKCTPQEAQRRRESVAKAKAMPHGTKAEKAARRQALRAAKLTPSAQYRSQQIRAAKQALQDCRLRNQEITAAPFVMDEIRKFDTPAYKLQLELAELVVANGPGGLLKIDCAQYRQRANALCEKDGETRKMRAQLLEFARAVERAQKQIRRYYPNGLQEPDPNRLTSAQDLQTTSFAAFLKKKQAISRAEKERAVYARCVAPFTKASVLVNRAYAYRNMDTLRAQYASVCR